MKLGYLTIIFTIALLMQGSLINLISIFGIAPNLILCLVVIFTFLYEDYNSIILGVFFGLLSDVCFSKFIGIAALGYLLVGLGVSIIKEILNRENAASVIFTCIAATVGYNFMYWALMYGLGTKISIVYWLTWQPLYIIYNVIVVMVLYSVLIKKVVRYRHDRYKL